VQRNEVTENPFQGKSTYFTVISPLLNRCSFHISSGNALFSLLGFLGMYAVLSILWVVLVYQFIHTGPASGQDIMLRKA
jgi:cytochrome bd-type quinol oxidase subunit 1